MELLLLATVHATLSISPPGAITSLFSVSIQLSILDISLRWNHTTGDTVFVSGIMFLRLLVPFKILQFEHACVKVIKSFSRKCETNEEGPLLSVQY
jgi:hypothetical protein